MMPHRFAFASGAARIWTGAALTAFAFLLQLTGTPASAAEIPLSAVQYSGGKAEVAFQATERAPKAALKGTVRVDGSNAIIDLSCEHLQPAFLFGGEVNTWVVWAVTPDGSVRNLGELTVGQDGSGAAQVSCPHPSFALMVTAEPFGGVRRPSDLVTFTSQPSKSKSLASTPVSSGELRMGTKRDVETLGDLRYTDKTPVELAQARRVVDLVVRYEGEKHAPEATKQAQAALDQAEQAFAGTAGKKSDVPDLARRSMVSATEAGRQVVQALEVLQATEREAKRQMQLDALGNQATEAERRRAETEAFLGEAARQRTAFQAERDQLQRERDELAHRVSGALGKVAPTEETGRGLVVSLAGGVLFDTGKYALKPNAKVALAKLAGILLMVPDRKLEIEGHTDNVGSEPSNQKLSLARAQSVVSFLKEQGVDEARMAAAGLGSTKPLAANDTAANRAKNRRVEVIVAGKAAAGTPQ